MTVDKVSIRIDVAFHDVDGLQVVWHGNYYKYMEQARSALFRKHGLDSVELAPGTYRLYVIDTACRHLRPLRYRDEVRVDAWFTEVEPRIAISYDVHSLTASRRVARGRTALVVVDADGKMIPTPREIVDHLLARSR
jgi:acyl-CoA thioester hydrolase